MSFIGTLQKSTSSPLTKLEHMHRGRWHLESEAEYQTDCPRRTNLSDPWHPAAPIFVKKLVTDSSTAMLQEKRTIKPISYTITGTASRPKMHVLWRLGNRQRETDSTLYQRKRHTDPTNACYLQEFVSAAQSCDGERTSVCAVYHQRDLI